MLGCLMKNPDLLFNERYPLCKDDFSPVELHKIIYCAIAKLAVKGAGIVTEVEIDNYVKDYPAKYEILQDGDWMGFVDTVRELSNSENYELYYNTVRKFSLLREMQKNGDSIVDYYDEMKSEESQNENLNKFTIEDIVRDIEVKSSHYRSKYDTNYTRAEMWAGEGFENVLDSFKETPAFGALVNSPYLTTLFQGWCRSHLLMRSAPSGMGKTRTAVGDLCMVSAQEMWSDEIGDFLVNSNFQGSSFYIHTEQKQETEIQPIFIACIANIPYHKIRKHDLTHEEELRVKKAAEILRASKIRLIDMPDFTISKLDSKIKECAVGHGCAYGVFDYIWDNNAAGRELKDMTGVSQRQDMLFLSIASQLKVMAENYNVGLYTMSQLNGNEKTNDIIDEACVFGSKAMKTKLDGGSIMLWPRKKELKLAEPYMRAKGFTGKIMPNMIDHVYKTRYGLLDKENIKVWSYLDKGTCRRTDLFCTDSFSNEYIKVPKPELEDF